MQHLNASELQHALQTQPGLIPIGLDAARRQLTWLDVGRFHFYEGFFHRSLAVHAGLRAKLGKPAVGFISDLDVLDSDSVLTENLPPTAFIFHAGRCGSTLLGKALARSRAHLVFGEAAPHNAFWEVLTDGWQRPVAWDEDQARRYRHLVLAMGRRRLATHRAHFIKFTSFNILLFDFIRRVFPDVPALFLYREPAAVLASYRNAAPGWLLPAAAAARRVLTGTADDAAEAALAGFYTAALQAGAAGLRYLDYAALHAAVLPKLLAAWQAAAAPAELAQMQAQFRYDAKADYGARGFVAAEPAREQGACDARLPQLYQQLAQAPLNF